MALTVWKKIKPATNVIAVAATFAVLAITLIATPAMLSISASTFVIASLASSAIAVAKAI